MILHPCIRLKHGRCVPPEITVERLETALGSRHDIRIIEEQVAEGLFWTALFIDEIDFRAMGKGESRMLSRAGALAEATEWLSGRDPRELPGYTAARENDIAHPLRFDELLAHVANATPSVIDTIRDLDDAAHWVDGVSLIDGRSVKIPINYVRLIHGPNGKAAGNCLAEAIVHALNEIFERRAHITVLRNRLVMPTIDPDSIGNRRIRETLEIVRGFGIRVTIKDLSFGGALPCVGVYCEDPNVPDTVQFHHFFKVGAAFDREEALLRAFTEYVQGRRRDEFGRKNPNELEVLLQPDFRRLPTQAVTCDNFLSAFMFGMVPYRDASFLNEGELVPFDSGIRNADARQDISQAIEILTRLGKDCFIVEHTDRAIGFPVVQVVVPSYSDTLPFHPCNSPALFRALSRSDVLDMHD